MRLLVAAVLTIACQAAHAWGPGDYPDCAGASQALQYSRTTGEFSCTTISGGGGSLPAGMIAAFNAACPTGWTELTAGRGRVIVGLPASGTLAGTVGTALTDLENRTHSHTYTEVVNHMHTVNITDPGHTHTLATGTGATGNFSQVIGTVDTSSGGTGGTPTQTALGTLSGSRTTSITAATVNPAGGVATGTTATKATSDVIPYIQLRLCQKD